MARSPPLPGVYRGCSRGDAGHPESAACRGPSDNPGKLRRCDGPSLYDVGLRTARTIMAFPATLADCGDYIVPAGVVPYPRGFAFGGADALFLASGIGPNGNGDNTIVAFAKD